MTSIEYITLEADDVAASEALYSKAFELEPLVRLKPAEAPSTGFRGYSLSLVASQPGNVDALLEAAVAHGATVLKPAAKSLWGYGAITQAPDGAIWKLACSSKKDSAPVEKKFDSFTVLLGTTDMNATKQFYTDHGLTVAKSYGRKYTEFEAAGSPVNLALYPRKAFAKDLGIPIEGGGSHRITIGGVAGPATDPDGFTWEAAS
ncbi:glyoxalase [Glycomyces sp. NRRL B-16210]|uniref:glyoxalase n=1 Tax=Glycomyces sp. NRRL B-16210 TaxID=1463821 RepID=UPI0004C19A2C|nr:glyoxalase [Glycomyces sp. NRRL B-16210]